MDESLAFLRSSVDQKDDAIEFEGQAGVASVAHSLSQFYAT